MQDAALARSAVPIGYRTRLDERLKIVLDGMPVGVSWATLDDGSIQFINRRLSQMLGYTVEDLPTVFDLFRIAFFDPAQRERARMATEHILAADNIIALEVPTQEIEMLCKDGTHKTVAFGGVVLPDAGWLVATFLDLSDRKERERLIERQAEEDSLTGLLNRRSFDAVLDDVLARREPGQSVHIILLDLDGFKQVNDGFGHAVGDQVLRQIAGELAKVVRHDDHLARIGGDEFAVVIAAADGRERIADVLRRIQEIFAVPFEIEGQQIRLGASAGVASCPEDGEEPLELYKKADRAMYGAKVYRGGASSTG